MKLLIVDDSAMVRRLIEAAYRGTVFTEMQTAADGLLAVTMYKQFNPDVVTLDITMPHMDGLAALGQILEHNPNAKVLVISALADHHTAIESLRRGASQFICKPFTAEDLRHSLDEVMNPSTARKSRSRRKRRDRMQSTASIPSPQPMTPFHQTQTMPRPTPTPFPAPTPMAPPNPQVVQAPTPAPPTPEQYPSGYVPKPSFPGYTA